MSQEAAAGAAGTQRNTGATVLVGAPGAGCTSVGRALAASRSVPFADLAEVTAQALGTAPGLALVAVPEERYRETEAGAALRLLQEAGLHGGVLTLGSGCLNDPQVRAALEELRAGGGQVVALTASTRCLSTRNGLDAPRSIALGTVHHTFTQMLHEREALCRQVADVVVDTTALSPQEAAQVVTGLAG